MLKIYSQINIFVKEVFYLCLGNQSIYFDEKIFIFTSGIGWPERDGPRALQSFL